MPEREDDFNAAGRREIAKRAGYLCSRPGCRKLTIGPGDRQTGTRGIGVAAHIHAASPGGPRFDSDQSSEERRSVLNGIWLCADDARFVDEDGGHGISAEALRAWKEAHEALIRDHVGKSIALLVGGDAVDSDVRLVDLRIEETENPFMAATDDPYPRLEVMVRNVGSKVALMKRVILHVQRLGRINLGRIGFRAVTVSAVYEASLDYERAVPFDLEVPVAQAVPANDVDRFQVRIGIPDSLLSMNIQEVLVYATLSIEFDEADRRITSPSFLFSVPMPKRILGMRRYVSPDQVPLNRQIVADFLSLPGERSGRMLRLAEELNREESKARGSP